jgi:putative colanic acid biosynthesis acetyltransferase WcaF
MPKTDLSKFDNTWYDTGANAFKRAAWYIVNAIFLNSAFPISRVKIGLLKAFGSKIGKRVIIKPHVNIKYPWKLTIGNNVWIGEGVWIDNLANVIMKDNVCISQGAFLLCGNHNYKKESFDLIVKEIIMEEGVWVGAKAIICPGVTCFSHSVLTVASVASKNLDADSIYSGNPAVKIRKRAIND